MSFIYENKRLIDLLTVAGAKHINKYGQANSAESRLDAQIAKKLLVQWQRKIDPANAPKENMLGMQGQKPGTPIGLTTEYLKSLGDLLNWAATNKITWNGRRFVWSDEEKKADTAGALKIPEDAGMFDVKGVKRERNTETRQPIQYLMWVSKKDLISFISFLRDSEEAKKNKVFQVMIGKLIVQANDSLEDNEQISKTPSQKPGAGEGELPDETVLTTFLKDLSLKNATSDGDKQLKYGDVKSDTAIVNWVKRSGITLTGEEQDAKPIASNDQKFDYCLLLRILYTKATYLLRSQSATPELKNKYTVFVNQLTKVAPSMQSPDGKACNLGAAQQPGQGQGEGGNKGQTQTQQMIHDVVTYMPLRGDTFDFTRVQAFFKAYEDLLSGTQSQQLSAIQTLHNRVNTAQQDSAKYLNTSMYNFPLSGDASQVSAWIRDPQHTNYVPFVRVMIAALEATRAAISMFYDAYADPKSSDKLNDNEIQIVAGQFKGDSYYQRNRWDLNRWLNTSDQVTGVKLPQ